MSRLVLGWGWELLRYSALPWPRQGARPRRFQRCAHVARLGYSTVGHYFYGLVRGKTVEETLKAVADDARRLQILHGWYLLDS